MSLRATRSALHGTRRWAVSGVTMVASVLIAVTPSLATQSFAQAQSTTPAGDLRFTLNELGEEHV